jgi:hypothetical protein
MRYLPYQELSPSSPNIIVDGAPGPGTILTLSHWPKSGTPAALKRDTSTEIAFAYLDSPNSHVLAEAVSNNHFDEDGLIGIYALVDTQDALRDRDLLIDAASAGDFGVFRKREAARMVFTISAFADPETSPLPRDIFEVPHMQSAGRLYSELLNLLPDFVSNLKSYTTYWEAEDAKLTATEQLISDGAITIQEQPALDLAIVYIRASRDSLPDSQPPWHPFAINSRTPCSRLLIIQGRHVEFQYRYESWVQLASRKPLPRVDLSDLARELNEQENSGDKWVFDGVDKITPRLHLQGSEESSISPELIRNRLEEHLRTRPAAWNPYD